MYRFLLLVLIFAYLVVTVHCYDAVCIMICIYRCISNYWNYFKKAKTVPVATFMESKANGVQRISNGFPSATNQFPHQVSIMTPMGAQFAVCGGSIISNIWIVTAAHCTQGGQVNLRFGSLDLWSGGTSQTSFRWIKHPQYDFKTMNYDISVVRIPSTLSFNNAINFIRLPRGGQANHSFLDYQSTVSGWGIIGPGSDLQTILRWVNMRVISNAQCARIYGQSVVVSHVMCTVGFNQPENQGHCDGDSGGPLIIKENGINTLIGIASFGASNGCHLGYPSGSMRTASFVNWIAAHTQIPVRNSN